MKRILSGARRFPDLVTIVIITITTVSALTMLCPYDNVSLRHDV